MGAGAACTAGAEAFRLAMISDGRVVRREGGAGRGTDLGTAGRHTDLCNQMNRVACLAPLERGAGQPLVGPPGTPTPAA